MGERITQPFDPYEPEPSYDWDYGEPEPSRGPNVLWGRVAALGGAVLFAFILGRASAPGGIPEEQLTTLRADNAELQAEIERLEAREDEADRALPTIEVTQAPTDESTAAAGQTYVVRPGDTLREIAERFYGDPLLDDLIAEANDITDPTELRVGQELTIPPKPEDTDDEE